MKLFSYIVVIILSISLCGCPYSSAYKLDETPNIYVEVKKPGINKEEPVKLVLSKKNDTEYNIAFTSYLEELKPFRIISNDSIMGTAYMSTLLGRQFLNIEIKSRVYIAEMKFDNNKLSVLPMAEHFTSRMIMSSFALRGMLEVHYKTRTHPMYDADFCLWDMVKVN